MSFLGNFAQIVHILPVRIRCENEITASYKIKSRTSENLEVKSTFFEKF